MSDGDGCDDELTGAAGPFVRGFARGLAEAMMEIQRECSVEWGEGYHGVGIGLSAHLCCKGAQHEGEHACYCGQRADAGVAPI